jgi:hypothetical protein
VDRPGSFRTRSPRGRFRGSRVCQGGRRILRSFPVRGRSFREVRRCTHIRSFQSSRRGPRIQRALVSWSGFLNDELGGAKWVQCAHRPSVSSKGHRATTWVVLCRTGRYDSLSTARDGPLRKASARQSAVSRKSAHPASPAHRVNSASQSTY